MILLAYSIPNTIRTPSPHVIQPAFHPSDDTPDITDNLVRIAVHARVFGLNTNSPSSIRITRRTSSLIDGGANICLTGDLTCLVDVTDIPPMPITVATTGNSPTTDDTCTKRGFLPLTLPDGTIYWQPCFYCVNAADTIISPQAILASSKFFSWTQMGYKDGRTGMIRFDSKDGLTTMQLALDFRDGLYYCPTDVITVNKPHSSSRAHLVSPTPIAARVHSDSPRMASR